MHHDLLRDARFWSFLLLIDQDLAKTARERGRIHYTNLWSSRSAEAKARFKAGLTIPWSAVAALNYGRGSYVADGRQYGATDVGISRLRFKPT